MNRFKKIISLLTAVYLCFGILGYSSSFARENNSDNEIAEALEILRLFNIIPDYSDYNIPYDAEVSRAEFVDAAVKLMNIGEYKGSVIYYYDVPRTHFAYDSICALTEMGIINGTADKKFEPDEAIEDAAAYKILLSIMGYGDYAYHNGGYPAGYLNAARRAEIYVDSATEKLTHEEMLKIMYRSLTANILEPIVYSADGGYTVAQVNENETILSLYYDVYERSGIVTGANCISLNDYALDDKNEVSIDDIVYNSDVDLSGYIGEEIEFFFRKISKDEKTVVWARRTGVTDVLYVEADNDTAFDESSFEFTYADNRKNSSIVLDRGIIVVYNGEVIGSGYSEIFNMPKCNIKFIKQNGIYNIAIVEAYENIVVDMINSASKTVYDKTDATKALKLDENLYEYISIKKVDGIDIGFEDIKSGDVLSVFLSKDKKQIKIISETSSQSGVITEIKKYDNEHKVIINDKEYKIPNSVFDDSYGVGDSVKIFLDYTGIVAYAEIEKGSSFAAYIINMATEEIFGEKVKIKMFKQDGAIAVYECAEKVTVDGEPGNAADVKAALMSDGKIKPQLVIIETDNKGIIRKVDTACFNSETENIGNTLVQNLEYAERHYKIQGYFGFDAAIDDNTVIFGVPKDERADIAEGSDYRLIKKSELKDDTMMCVMSYNLSERTGYEQFVVVKEDEAMAYGQDLPVIITGKGNILGDDGTEVECVEGYQGKVFVTIPSNGILSFNDVEKGMLVRFKYTRSGSAAEKTILFDPEKPELYYTNTAPFNNIYGVEVGFVNDVIGDVIKIGYGSGANVNHVSNMYNSPPVMVYDKNDSRNPVYSGNFGDARRYYNVLDDCSRVVLITRHCTPILYVIYN